MSSSSSSSTRRLLLPAVLFFLFFALAGSATSAARFRAGHHYRRDELPRGFCGRCDKENYATFVLDDCKNGTAASADKNNNNNNNNTLFHGRYCCCSGDTCAFTDIINWDLATNDFEFVTEAMDVIMIEVVRMRLWEERTAKEGNKTNNMPWENEEYHELPWTEKEIEFYCPQ